jgi:hypothetical protein
MALKRERHFQEVVWYIQDSTIEMADTRRGIRMTVRGIKLTAFSNGNVAAAPKVPSLVNDLSSIGESQSVADDSVTKAINDKETVALSRIDTRALLVFTVASQSKSSHSPECSAIRCHEGVGSLVSETVYSKSHENWLARRRWRPTAIVATSNVATAIVSTSIVAATYSTAISYEVLDSRHGVYDPVPVSVIASIGFRVFCSGKHCIQDLIWGCIWHIAPDQSDYTRNVGRGHRSPTKGSILAIIVSAANSNTCTWQIKKLVMSS